LPDTHSLRGGSTEGFPLTDNDTKARETEKGLIQGHIDIGSGPSIRIKVTMQPA